MKKVWLSCVLAALLAGCGDDDTGGGRDASSDAGAGADATVLVPDAQLPDATLSPVTISIIDHNVTMTGGVDTPWPGVTVQVENADGTGGVIRREGTTGADGRVTIAEVPGGELLYSYRTTAGAASTLVGFFTSQRSLDLGADLQGGLGAGTAATGTALNLTLTGLTPWTASHGLRLLVPTQVSPITTLSATTPAGISGLPTSGATGLSGLRLPWTRPLPDATDQLLLVQRETAVQGVLSVTRIIKSFALPVPAALTSGAATPFTGAFTEPTPVTVPVRIDGTQWTALVPRTAPNAFNDSVLLRFFGGPPPLDKRVEIANALLVGSVAAANVDVMFGDPFSGGRVVTIIKQSQSSVAAQGARSTVLLPATITAIYDLSALPAAGLVPVLSPVESPLIAGRDARQSQTGVGLTPVLSWSPPSIGTPTHHEVAVYEVFNDAGATSTRFAADLHTDGNSLRIPAGVLADGKTYLFAVVSDTWRRTGAAERTYPRLPVGTATTFSALSHHERHRPGENHELPREQAFFHEQDLARADHDGAARRRLW